MSKKESLRSCLGCRTVKAKKELIRIVRIADKTVKLDLTGKNAGRGAYTCFNEECINMALKGKKLETALKTSINKEKRDHLRKGLIKAKVNMYTGR